MADAFPFEVTQWQDTDGDGYGDNWEDPLWNQTHLEWGIGQWLETAHQPDACPFILGISFADRYGCPDTDGDAWSDPGENWTAANGADAFPFEPTQWRDRDFDGYGDNQTEGAKLIDDFPDNPTQFRDSDFDGWGDNQTYGATQIDDFPMIPSQYRDSDGDGFGDDANIVSGCRPEIGLTTIGGDCDDSNAGISPVANEICDEIDNNCNDEIDENAIDAIFTHPAEMTINGLSVCAAVYLGDTTV